MHKPIQRCLEPSPELDMVLTQRKQTLQRGIKPQSWQKGKQDRKKKNVRGCAHDKEKVKRAREQTTQQHPAAI